MIAVTARVNSTSFWTTGLLRGIDPQKQLFYVTTPEPQERLRRVNALVMGNSDSPELCFTVRGLAWLRMHQYIASAITYTWEIHLLYMPYIFEGLHGDIVYTREILQAV